MLTGLPGSPDSLWGFVSLAHVPLASEVEPEPEEPQFGGGSEFRDLRRRPGKKRRRNDDEAIAVLLALM